MATLSIAEEMKRGREFAQEANFVSISEDTIPDCCSVCKFCIFFATEESPEVCCGVKTHLPLHIPTDTLFTVCKYFERR